MGEHAQLHEREPSFMEDTLVVGQNVRWEERLTWQYVFISVLLDILLPLSYIGGVDLLCPVFS